MKARNQNRNGRRGDVFSVRLTDDERASLERLQAQGGGPRAIGAWLRWTKRTALWGDFELPTRGPFVKPIGGGPLCHVCDPQRRKSTWCNNSAHRAITAPGFARAFFLANP